MSLFCAQDYPDNELIVYNTDTDYPIVLGDSFSGFNIRVFNSDTDSETGQKYRDVGSIRRDALNEAKGDYYICWDDDDIFLPWNNLQCFHGIEGTRLSAWKPKSSMACFKKDAPEISQNYMEASYIVRMSALRECGYDLHVGGKEHMRWVHKFDREKTVLVEENSIPSYAFNWSDPPAIGGHKNSGSINREDNYTLHRNGCHDKHTRKLERLDISAMIQPYVQLLKRNQGQVVKNHYISPELYERYVSKHDTSL